MVDDVPGLRRIIGMLLIDDNDKIHAAAMRLGDTVIQVLAFAVLDGGIIFLKESLVQLVHYHQWTQT